MPSTVALMWADSGAGYGRRRGTTMAERLTEGAAAYRDRFGIAPTTVVVAASETAEATGAAPDWLRVVAGNPVDGLPQPGNYWFKHEG